MLTLENRKVLKSGIEIPTSRNMKKEEAINPKQGGKRKQKQKSVSLKQENNKKIIKQKADSKKNDKIGKSLIRLIKVEDRSQQYHEMKQRISLQILKPLKEE